MVDLLSGIQSTSAALNAERTRMDVISENPANVQTKGYQRKAPSPGTKSSSAKERL